MSEAGLRPAKRTKPAISYDYGKGYSATRLTSQAVQAMRARGRDTRKMEQELRSYLRYRGVEEARPTRVLQIVSRYVDVYPTSMIEMERALGGREAARMGLPDEYVPRYTWNVQDFLYHLDVRYGHDHREEVFALIESSIGDLDAFTRISHRHLRRHGYDEADLARWSVRRRAAAKKSTV